MADDLPFYAPGAHANIAPRLPQPGEEVWRLQNEQGQVVTCELRNDSRAGLGWDVQLLENGEFLFSKRCALEAGARWVAECIRQDHIRTGFTERATNGTDPAESETPNGSER